MMVRHAVFASIAALAVLAGCAPQPGGTGGGSQSERASTQPKRVVAAVMDEIPMVYQKLNPASRVRGIDALQLLVDAGLSVLDDGGVLRAQIAEAVPSADNGLWKVLPDGTMETTWKIKPGVQWHDLRRGKLSGHKSHRLAQA